ncbi:MAG: hypothetical protein M1818_008510 [Claussenomyces sp. TS43310]|nr:MAG: hypothetical protein M1818_008510 [Claussenomyces sp. TS43310]
MAGPISKKRKLEDLKGRPKKPVRKFKKQTDYYSDSEDDLEPEQEGFQAVNLQDSDGDDSDNGGAPFEIDAHEEGDEGLANDGKESDSEVTDASKSDEEDEDESGTESNPNLIKKRKRNDPDAFATSMSKILDSKLSTSKRGDPVLSRSVTALQASREFNDLALEKKAKQKLREERRAALDKGRVKDVLGASTAFDTAHGDGVPTMTTAETMALEKRLRKTAQRGVVKLFNAVRAAQVKGEEAAKEARQKGLIGQGRREERVNEMSKQGFLDLIAGGGGGLKAGGMEEA